VNDDTTTLPPVQEGDIVRLVPVIEDGHLIGYRVIDARTGAVRATVPASHVSVAAPDRGLGEGDNPSLPS